MGKLLCEFSMSLDGYVAGPGVSPDELSTGIVSPRPAPASEKPGRARPPLLPRPGDLSTLHGGPHSDRMNSAKSLSSSVVNPKLNRTVL